MRRETKLPSKIRDGSPPATLAEALPDRILARLPPIEGAPISLRFGGGLRASRSRLASAADENGTGWPEVHAGTFIRWRRTILDRALLEDSDELTRIVLHELFHYAWTRLGNPARESFGNVLRAERAARAAGELGWSSWIRKERLRDSTGRLWREYVCEAFCDTAACLYSGIAAHEEFTLAPRFRRRRERWFQELFRHRALLV